MAYTKKIWKDYPNTTTPILASDMNDIEDGLAGVLDWIYPVGTIYETTSTDLDTTTKMANHFGGTWEVYGSGRVLVAKSEDTEFDTIGETGGATTHTLTVGQMPTHSHNTGIAGTTGTGSYGISTYLNDVNIVYLGPTQSQGGGQAHNNLQPYIVVYRYRRTA